MTYVAADDRYDQMPYRRCGRSGLVLPADLARPLAQLRRRSARSRRAARSCAAPSTSASPTSTSPTTTARRTARPRRTSAACCARTSGPYRDELVISTKAGYDMWPGPYGDWGSRKYLLASLDQSLRRHGPRLRRHLLLAPLRPGHAARGDDGRARHARCARARRSTSGISSYSAESTREAAAILRELGTPLLIHQPSLLDAQPLDRGGPARRARRARRRLHRLLAARAGHAHRPVPERHPGGLAREPRTSSLAPSCSPRRRSRKVRALNEIAAGRGQTLAQMALAWVLRDPRVTSALIGASSVAQLEQNLAALDTPGSRRTSSPRSTRSCPRAAGVSLSPGWPAIVGVGAPTAERSAVGNHRLKTSGTVLAQRRGRALDARRRARRRAPCGEQRLARLR